MKRAKISKQGKWSRDSWIRILELLAKMPQEERQRCLKATTKFYKGR